MTALDRESLNFILLVVHTIIGFHFTSLHLFIRRVGGGGIEGFERTPFAGQFVNLFEGLNLMKMMQLQKFALRNGIVLLWVDKLYK